MLKIDSASYRRVLQRSADPTGQLDVSTHQLRAIERHSDFYGSSIYLDNLIKSHRVIVKKSKQGMAMRTKKDEEERERRALPEGRNLCTGEKKKRGTVSGQGD